MNALATRKLSPLARRERLASARADQLRSVLKDLETIGEHIAAHGE